MLRNPMRKGDIVLDDIVMEPAFHRYGFGIPHQKGLNFDFNICSLENKPLLLQRYFQVIKEPILQLRISNLLFAERQPPRIEGAPPGFSFGR
jgi:hypothetical protein